ncbi:long chain acyl-CoA synthetase 2-like [Chenopodium quinoa]|uniref:Long-chain-fatty-acid--CoA ligase n=1 Tax=Chenopodium quinoa TaxID=63459 RepID=A0A803LNZ4_CHEQI|nr:long chain acyl-CoA synthetase 2-like [Chenopodium quinoa]
MAVYTEKVEEGRAATGDRPSTGAVYRNIYAVDALTGVPDGIESPWDLFSKSVEKYPTNHLLGSRKIVDGKAGPYEWLTYKEVYDSALQIGSAIRKCGVNPGGQCGIYGSNCPKWIIAMQACNGQAISYVPLYDTLGPNAVEFIINHAEVSLVFVREKKIPAILACLSKCNYLKTIVSFENISSSQRKEAEEAGVSCFSWDEFSQLGTMDCEIPLKQKTDVCTVMYTSGTTGEPKGVILNNAAFTAEVFSVDYLFEKTDKSASTEDVYFSFLPLAHIFDQIVETYCIAKGTSIGFWQGDVRYLIEDLHELKPTMFCGVPRVFERLYNGIVDKVSSSGALRKSLFDYAYSYKLRNLEKGLRQDEAAPLLDKLVFNKIKQSFGGRVRIMISGGAPLPRHVEEFLRVTCCCVVVQGYGLTESCGGCFTSIANVYSMIGTVGIPSPAIDARLESVPEMEYDALSTTPRGEICLRGNILFSGYHKRQDLTQEVLIDGWFHTGDIGEWQPDGSMKVIDRKKNIFKLSQGEYVAVENLESIYSRCNLITSIWVYGNSFESFLVAVVVPERKAIENWAANNNETGDFETLCKSTKARKYFLEELNSTGQKHKLRGFEMLKAVFLEPIPFDVERDLMTPTFKLKRPQLLKYYKDTINEMYNEAKGKKA